MLGQTFSTEDYDDQFNRLSEFARQGRFSLAAAGTRAAPSWRVWLSYCPTSDEIATTRANDDIADEDESEADWVPPTAEPILGRRPVPGQYGHKGYEGGERAILDYLSSLGESDLAIPFPEWGQVPAYDLGFDIEVPPADLVGGTDDRDWTGGRTTLVSARKEARIETRDSKLKLTDNRGELTKSVRSEIERVSARTNDSLRQIFDPAPTLSFEVGGPSDWIEGEVPHWVQRPSGQTKSFSIEATLSAAELRWARIALGVAEMRFGERPTIVVCDEPEKGLHLSAERRLPEALSYIAQRDEVAVLNASHSHYTLVNPNVSVIRVDKTAERGTSLDTHNTISLVDSTSRKRSELELSLTPAELQSLMKVAVVVEGLHDEVVFSHLLRKELDAAVAGIFPLRGGAKTPTLLEAKLLIDGSDVPILVILDNTNQEEVEPIWNEIVSRDKAGDKAAARKLADEKLVGSAELTYLKELARAGIESGGLGRVRFFGVRHPDVICYLPEDLILTRDEGTRDWKWEKIIEAFLEDEQSRKNQQGKKFQPRSIKKFLNSHPSSSNPWFPAEANSVNKAIEAAAVEAARTGRERHDDLNELAAKILELS